MTDVAITRIENVGDQTVAIELETPADFEAFPGQFVLVWAMINDEEETGYYTISSPNVTETFEITVAVSSDGTLGPWLAQRSVGEEITVDGPFGDVQYSGESDATVIAGGPGIGPAVGIGERAISAGYDVTIVYGGVNPPHTKRLTALEEDGAAVIISADVQTAVGDLELSGKKTFIFGFEGFVEQVEDAFSTASLNTDDVEIESFGPE